MSPGPVWICNRFTSQWEPTHIQTAACKRDRGRQTNCVWACVCAHILVQCACQCRCEVSAEQELHVSVICMRTCLFLVYTRIDKGIAKVTWSYSPCVGIWDVDSEVGKFFFFFFGDKGICRRREASAVQRTPGPSVASQADGLLTVQRMITGHGK